VDLQDWNASLFNELVKAGRREERLYLYVDRNVLAGVSGHDDGQQAVEDFCAAFRQTSGVEPFAQSATAATAWRATGWIGEPPIVAALAMTVLAVTEDPIGSTNGVYRRQNQLLGLPEEAQEPDGYGSHVPILWKVWNQWLEGVGSCYGKPSARTHEHWTRQGWARSQALVRYRDRILLEDFFSGIRLTSEDTRRTELIADQFLAWLAYRGQAAADLLERLQGDAPRPVLIDVVADEMARWDGSGRKRTNGRGVQGLLFYDEWADIFSVVIEVDDRLVGIAVDAGGEVFTPSEFDPYIRVSTEAPSAELLSAGTEWQLQPDLRMRLTPEPVYVMRDEPQLGGRIQVRAGATATTYSVLVRDDRAELVLSTLHESGARPTRRPCSTPGWGWLENVTGVTDGNSLRTLGLGSLAPRSATILTLEGGLALGHSDYLVGGEPDLVIPAGVTVTIDGLASNPEGKTQVIRLADACPSPGQHTIIAGGGTEIRYRSLPFVRDRSEASNLAWELPDPGTKHVVLTRHGFTSTAPTLSGAVIQGVPQSPDPVMRTVPGWDHLVVTETGEVLQVWPETERWLQRIDLEPNTVDVLRATRTLPSRAAFFLTLNPRTGAIRAISVPAESNSPPGKVPTLRRPDLLVSLLSPWRWVGPPADDRRRDILSNALQPGHQAGPPQKESRRPDVGARPTRRIDISTRPLADNPYDEILEWLSERETGRASIKQFAEAWKWACSRPGLARLADDWRLAAHHLVLLGHIECDYERQQVGVAAAGLVSLPAANGLSLLTGSRPRRLLERLEDEGDELGAVANASLSWEVHTRTQLDANGLPGGPTSVFLEWDRAAASMVTAGLDALGVQVCDSTAVHLLGRLPSLDESLSDSLPLSMPPSRSFLFRHNPAYQDPKWIERDRDWSSGLYRYKLARGDQFVWLSRHDQKLWPVDRQDGFWLDERDHGRTGHLKHHSVRRVLFVPRHATLPALIARSLVLRTGLLPTLVQPQPMDGMRAGEHFAYANVDEATADFAAVLLGQTVVSVNGSLENVL
jgi:hypothetical protein